ncbi:MAG: YhbY family RNA-binding protein [Clostridia bacterium]|nr:YhbY family RNA-binding protein [Clostridia bacterium]MBR4458539.1 YhbY family RNA-binding protein [Clostridia bacterium]
MTSKQRAMLRGMASTMDPVLYIGRDGITPGTLTQVEEDLEAHELIKGTVQQNCPMTAKEALVALCEATGAEPVQFIGRRFVLYRPSSKEPKIILA